MNGRDAPDDHSAEPTAPALPAHLGTLARLAADAAVLRTPLVERVRARLAHLPFHVLEKGQGAPQGPGHTLHLTAHKGRFLRPCPGTKRYRCCAYRIVHTGEGCPMACSYCVLRAYLGEGALRVFANQERLFDSLGRIFGADPARRFRVGTGQFTDSLALEAVTGYARDLVAFLAGHENVCLELKSKVVDLSWMDAVARPDRVLPAWSVNAPPVCRDQEAGTSSLEARLAAARTCAEAGFRVCLHFDPIVYYPGWDRDYARTVEMIADHVRPESVAYVSLGSFRLMPGLSAQVADNPLYQHAEYVLGLDGKRRLLRPLRSEQMRFVARALSRAGFSSGLYLCMESDTVWREVFGHTPKTLGGLAAHLMDRAFGTGGD
ncbi:hypothetical protein JCM15519_19780 [Fundidesulfovibrio butyratiphilus]